jgi:hypothetical protein
MIAIKIKYDLVDGMHFFTPVEEDSPALGLIAGAGDYKTAFKDVAVQLKTLFKFNHKKKVTVVLPIDTTSLTWTVVENFDD